MKAPILLEISTYPPWNPKEILPKVTLFSREAMVDFDIEGNKVVVKEIYLIPEDKDNGDDIDFTELIKLHGFNIVELHKALLQHLDNTLNKMRSTK